MRLVCTSYPIAGSEGPAWWPRPGLPRSHFPSHECSLPYLNRCLAGRPEHTVLAFVWPMSVLLLPHTVSSWRLLIAQHPRLGSSLTSPYLLSQCSTPPTKLLGILKMSFRQVVFSPLLMNNLAFAEALECLWDSRRVVVAVAAEFALAQGLGRGMVFAKDSFPKAIPTGPTLFYLLVQVNSPHGKKPPVGLPTGPLWGKAESFLLFHLCPYSPTGGVHHPLPLWQAPLAISVCWLAVGKEICV